VPPNGPAPGLTPAADRAARTESRVALLGLGVTGLATARHLLARGVAPALLDRPEVVERARAALGRPDLPGGPIAPETVRRLRPRTVFVTPGLPKQHPAVAEARALGAEVTGEIPYALAALRQAGVMVAGVTGTSGKTTTVSLAADMLRGLPGVLWVGGNLGRPVIEDLDPLVARAQAGETVRVVLELSSFQLDLCRTSPRVAALLNLYPNHLDVHPSLEDYRRAKLEILRHQTADDVAVLSADQPVAGAEACGAARRFRFGLGPPTGDGFFVVGGDVCRVEGGRPAMAVVPVADIPLPGRHNVANVLAACAVAHLLGAAPEGMARAVAAFRGVPHRLEPVAERDGVRFVDDSIATSPDRTEAALLSVEGPVVLIAGGSDKGLDYAPLGPVIARRARALLVIGDTGSRIAAAAAAAGGPVAVRCADLAEAVARASAMAQAGDTVLLAPASASFDQFANYAERGDRFAALALALPGARPLGRRARPD
jgi:UDP-N-acetylmuramoylalanine--D-glutamate ligase